MATYTNAMMCPQFQVVTAFDFVSPSVGFEHEGHEILAGALVVNLALGDNILGELSDPLGEVLDVGVHSRGRCSTTMQG